MGIPEFSKWMNPLWWNLFDLLLRRSVNAKKLAHSIRIAPSHTIPKIYEVAKY
jgi:DNA-binding Xre family transcriptional regulator